VFAKSFARIHRRNLVAQGIPALSFSDDADYERAEVGDAWTLPSLRDELAEGAAEITVRTGSGEEFTVAHDFAPKERQVLVAGGLLSYLREHGERLDGDGARRGRARRRDGDRTAAQREERDQGPGGRAD
jgi:aconitate hydratase